MDPGREGTLDCKLRWYPKFEALSLVCLGLLSNLDWLVPTSSFQTFPSNNNNVLKCRFCLSYFRMYIDSLFIVLSLNL